MYRYTVFGRLLESELAFPELRSSMGTSACWRLRVARPVVEPTGELMGVGTEPNCRVALYRRPRGFVLHHSCTGAFDICAGGTELAWRRKPGAALEAVRADVLGRVLAVAFHLMGDLPLHASAIATGGRAIAFLGPKGSGKSTLAVALAAAGAALLTDDMLAVRPGAGPTVPEGIRSARLHDDSAVRLLGDVPLPAPGVDGKHRIGSLPGGRLGAGETPLDALYLLVPERAGAMDDPIRREPLPGRIAAVRVAGHAKAASLLGASGASTILSRSVELVRALPTYELHVPIDFARLGDAVDRLLAWHPLDAAPLREMAS